MIPLLSGQEWYCPSCGLTEQTRPVPNRFHACPRFAGLTVPLVPGGTNAKHELRYREDYVGNQIPQTDGAGRPVMSVVTTRDNGQDVVVFAPTARIQGESHGLVGE